MSAAHTRYARRYDAARVAFYDLAGRRVSAARMAAGVSQRELADAVGVSHSAITQYESGVMELPFHVAAKIADYLDTTIDDFAPVQVDQKVSA